MVDDERSQTFEEFILSSDEDDGIESNLIERSVKYVSRILRSFTRKFKFTAHDILSVTNRKGGETDKFSVNDYFQFWSLLYILNGK